MPQQAKLSVQLFAVDVNKPPQPHPDFRLVREVFQTDTGHLCKQHENFQLLQIHSCWPQRTHKLQTANSFAWAWVTS